MDEGLTIEQRYQLRKLALEIENYSREELKEELLACWEEKFQQKQCFLSLSQEAGIIFKLDDYQPASIPTSEEEFKGVFGYEPTTEEKAQYVQNLYEEVEPELDMDEIVLDSED